MNIHEPVFEDLFSDAWTNSSTLKEDDLLRQRVEEVFKSKYLRAVLSARNEQEESRAWHGFYYWLTVPSTSRKPFQIPEDDADKIIEIALLAQKHYPNLQIVARAIDRHHAYELLRIGVKAIKRETFESALELGVSALELLGNSPEDSKRAGKLFSDHDKESMHVLSEVWGDDHSYGVAVKQRMELLQQVLVSDKEEQSKMQTCQKSKD